MKAKDFLMAQAFGSGSGGGSGDSGVFPVVSQDGMTADKNANEIIAAIVAHKYPVFYDETLDGCVAPFHIVEWGASDDNNKVIFSTPDAVYYSVDAEGNVDQPY